MAVLLLLVCLFLSSTTLAESEVMFSADVKVLVTTGYYESKMYYYYSEAKQYIRYDYTSPTKLTEITDFIEKAKYVTESGSCEFSYHELPMPLLFKGTGDTSTGIVDEDGCEKYIPEDTTSVSATWYASNGTVCKAELTNGKTLVFSNVNTAFNDESYFVNAVDQCSGAICKRAMDLVLVIDLSDSVGEDNWNNGIKHFMETLVNSLDIGKDAVQIGLLTYGSYATKVLDLSPVKSTIFDAINSASYTGGGTCIGCGINTAISLLNNTATHRTDLDPEKIMIVVAGSLNNQSQGTSCADYKSTCTKKGTACEIRTCSGTWKTTTTSVCEEYGDSSTCKRYMCNKCNGEFGSTCISKTCSKYTTSICAYRDTSYCVSAYPTGCTIKNGVITTPYYSGAKCLCSEYRCIEYECISYKCNEYACDDCASYSSTCAEYEKTCKKYATIQTCSGTETCAEYECIGGKAVCNITYNSDKTMLNGAIALTRTQWVLYPASKQLPIVIAIGVGSIRTYEVNAIASTINGKKLSYFVSSYDYLSTITQDIIGDICTNKEDYTACSADCHGVCGLDGQCRCPNCDIQLSDPLHMYVSCNETSGECIAKDIEYTITFDLDDEKLIKKKFTFNETVEYPENVEKEGYTLDAWDINITNMPDNNITIKALWAINNYTLRFVFDNGTEDEVRILNFNQEITYPAVTEREGYTYEWSINITHMPARNITIAVLWTEIPTQYVEIVFSTSGITKEGVYEFVEKYTNDNFEVLKIEKSDGGEVKATIKFTDTEKAWYFFDTVSGLVDTKEIRFVDASKIGSFGISCYPIALFSIFMV